MDCCKSYLYLSKKIHDTHYFAFVPARCKSWSCPICRPIKAKQVSSYIQDHFRSKKLFMLTLTFYHRGSVRDCWAQIGKRWNRMRTFISKKYGRFDYLRMVEPHKKGGWPHLHVLIKGCVIDKEITKMITNWGFGWNMHFSRVSNKNAASYISKYLTKEWPTIDAEVLRQSTKTRIVCVSRGLPAVFTTTSEWSVVQHSIPNANTLFYLNAFIQYLKNHKASFIFAKPFSQGFVIESDVEINFDNIERLIDPYIWKYCDRDIFEFAPFGRQLQLNL